MYYILALLLSLGGIQYAFADPGGVPDSYAPPFPHINAQNINQGKILDTHLSARVTRNLYLATIPLIIPSSGVIGSNGAVLTLTTALPTIYANCYMYFPANAITTGSAAGLYFTQMSSTTAGTIFQNMYTTGVPIIIASPTSWTSAIGGAFTSPTTAITLQQYVMPGNTMGATDGIRIQAVATDNNTGNNHTITMTVGGTTIRSVAGSTVLAHHEGVEMYTRGVLNSEVTSNGVNGAADTYFSSTNNAVSYLTKDMSQPQTIAVTAQLAVATDFMVLEVVRVDHL